MENCDLIFIILGFFLPLFAFGLIKLGLFIATSIAERVEFRRITKEKYFDCVDNIIKDVTDLHNKFDNICRTFNSKLSVFDDSLDNLQNDIFDLNFEFEFLKKRVSDLEKKKTNKK